MDVGLTHERLCASLLVTAAHPKCLAPLPEVAPVNRMRLLLKAAVLARQYWAKGETPPFNASTAAALRLPARVGLNGMGCSAWGGRDDDGGTRQNGIRVNAACLFEFRQGSSRGPNRPKCRPVPAFGECPSAPCALLGPRSPAVAPCGAVGRRNACQDG
jgi:hypothetical protein